MIKCRPGDVVLLRFPFTDQQTAKRRPALVVSPESYQTRHGDIVALALTTKPQNDAELALSHWAEAGLPKESWVKPLIGSFASSIIHRRLGAIGEGDWGPARAAIRKLLVEHCRR